MDEQRPNDRNHLIEFVAATVEAMRHEMVTKDEFRREIAALSGETADIRGEMATMRGEMTTMRGEMATMRGEMATMRGEMATKGELRRLEEKLSERMDAGFTAVRGDIERVGLRLDQVDRNQSLHTAAVENGVSRLRAVVYLLVKDQPDLVRMLG